MRELTGNETGATVEEITHYIKHVTNLEEELIKNGIDIMISLSECKEGVARIILATDYTIYPGKEYRTELNIDKEFNSIKRIYGAVIFELSKFISNIYNEENLIVDRM